MLLSVLLLVSSKCAVFFAVVCLEITYIIIDHSIIEKNYLGDDWITTTRERKVSFVIVVTFCDTDQVCEFAAFLSNSSSSSLKICELSSRPSLLICEF